MEYTSSYTGAQIDAAVGSFNQSTLEGVHAIELNLRGDLSGYGGFIDFHYNGSSSDYTSRIIETSSGVLVFNNNITVEGNSMFAMGWGNVGIGTNNPQYKLDVNGYMRCYENGECVKVYGNYIEIDSSYPSLVLYNTDLDDSAEIVLNADGELAFSNNYSGPAYFYNDVYAPSFQQNSDIRKKNVTGDVLLSIYNVANAPLFKFTWKDERMKGEHIGSSAQYWQEILPEAISVGKDPMQSLSMDYSTIALASAITTAKSVVDHEERIAALEKENEALRKEIEAIKAA